MANITLTGTLLDPNSDLAVGDEIRFTHKSTTGQTVKGAISLVSIGPTGTYSVPLQYGLVLVEYKDVRSTQFKNLGIATVNATNTATSIPELLNALVPVSSAELIEFQAILADAVAAAATSEAFANQLTTLGLIASTATFSASTVLNTSGYTTSGDGGKGKWKQNGQTGQTASQSPAQLGSSLLNDANGNQWALVVSNKLNTKSLGCIHDGAANNNTLAFRAAILSPHRHIDITDGDLLVTPESTTTDPLFLSAVIGRTLTGVGTLTANAQIKRLIRFTGARSRASINVDGNNNIGYAISMQCVKPVVRKCNIRDLNGFTDWGGVGVKFELDGLDTYVVCKNNTFDNLYAVGDGVGANGAGMNRAVIAECDQNVTSRSVISNNEMYNVKGEEGDAIVIICSNGAGTYYDFPCDIRSNTIHAFTRRGVKVQASRVDVILNTISNDLTVASGQEQRAIDIVQGNNLTVGFNTLIDCKFMSQIAVIKSSTEVSSNINIINNTITGIGTETSNNLIALSYVDDVIVSSNKIYCENHTGGAYYFRNTNKVYFDAVITVTSGTKLDKASTTSFNYLATPTDAEALVLSVNGFTNRSLQLHNADASLNDGELISAIEFHQNDNNTDSVTASIKTRAVGTSGATKMEFSTGNPTSAADVLGLTLDQSGNVLLERDGTTISLKDSAGTSYALSVDTSGRLLIGGVVVGTQT
jgi:hypothetical protein